MASKITEFEINQIIIEETKAVVEEKQQLNEIAPILAGIGAMLFGTAGGLAGAAGGATAAGVAGSAIAAVAARTAVGALMGTTFKAGSAIGTGVLMAPLLGILQRNFTLSAKDPDLEVILKQSRGAETEALKKKTAVYFAAYKEMVLQATAYCFAPTTMVSKAQEYVPDFLGKTSGFTINFEPHKPSKEAAKRMRIFATEINTILQRNPAFSAVELKRDALRSPIKRVVDNFIIKEFKIAGANNMTDRMPTKSRDRALSDMDRLIDVMVGAAIDLNKEARGVTDRVEASKDTDSKTTPAGGKRTTAATTIGSRYVFNDATPEEVRQGKEVVKPFDKSPRTGIVGYIQGLLQKSGFDISLDGYYGPNTLKAVRSFTERFGGLQEQAKGDGVIDSDILGKMESYADTKEVEDIADGKFLPPEAKAGPTKVSEEDADSVSAQRLKRKVEKLKAKIETGVSNEERATKRLERMQSRLDKKLGRTKMQVKKSKLEEIIEEETTAVLSEQSSALDLDRYTRATFSTLNRNLPETSLDDLRKIYKILNEDRAFNLSGLSTGIDRMTIFPDAEGGVPRLRDAFTTDQIVQIAKMILRGIMTYLQKVINKSASRSGFESAMNDLFANNNLRGVIGLTSRMSQAAATGNYTTNVAALKKPGDDADAPSRPQVPAGGAKRVTLPSSDVKDIPSDWRRFASVSSKHAEMAKAWLAATGKLTEAALPNDSSYKAFQKWYSETAGELGRQFGPGEGIKLINQAAGDKPAAKATEPATEPEATEPEATEPVSSTASAVALRASAPAIAKAVKDLRDIEKALKAKKGPTKTVVYDFSKVDEFLPGGIADFGRMMFAKGPVGNRRKAIQLVGNTITMLSLLKGLIEQGQDATVSQTNQVKQTAEEIKAEMEKIRSGAYDSEPDEFEQEMAAAGALEESVKRRWQKLIKG